MSHHPVKAFPLQQNALFNSNKRVPSPGQVKQLSKDRYAESSKKTPTNEENNANMRRSKSSGLLRKSDQNGNQIGLNSGAKNRINEGARGSSQSTKNAQDTILNSLQNILHNQLSPSTNQNVPGSSHKRTQSNNINGSSGLIVKNQKNSSITNNNQVGNFNQFSYDQISAKGIQNGSSLLKQSNDYSNTNNNNNNVDYANLKSLSTKNIYKPSPASQNRYTPLTAQNKSGMKGYTSIQSRIETNDRLPKLESLILQQQQQMQPNNSNNIGQTNGFSNNNNNNVNNSTNKGQSKDQLKSKLQNDLFKDNDVNNSHQNGMNSISSSKNAKPIQNYSQNSLQNSSLFSSGPKININLQIKNLNIISPNGLRNSNQAQTNDNTPLNYHHDDSHHEDNQDMQKLGGLNRQQHSRNPTQIIQLQQGSVNNGMKQNNSTPQLYQANNLLTNNNNNTMNNNSKLINPNSNNALVNGYSGYQQQISTNTNSNNNLIQNKSAIQNVSESRQSSRRARSNSKEKNDSFSQPKSNKNGLNNPNPVDFIGKYANPFGKSTTNLKAQLKPQSQSIDAQRRNSKKLGNNSVVNEPKPNQIVRKNSSHQQLQNQQKQETTPSNVNNNMNKINSSQTPALPAAPKNIISSYAVRSKPGALPGKPVKTNQDSYIIQTNFCKNKQKYFFSVCDGHGINGHHASQYVKKVLAGNIEFFLKQFCREEFNSLENQNSTTPPQENFSAITQSLTSGYLKTAAGLLDSGIDITFSGSTCVGVYMTAERYWCANIGDSRAIVGRYDQNTSKWSNQPLSIDHKPDLQAEYERIMASGGRVEPFKDMDGNPVGPARVWMRHENIPGLAMARSFGDYVASQVGVIPEPEVLHFDIHPNDRFLVVASDGIWEFLSNEDVVSMIAPFFYKNDPEGACEKLVKEATAAWKREDEVIDDITILIVFFQK